MGGSRYIAGAGDPFFSKFLDLEIYQDSTIRVREADRIGDTKISKWSIKKSIDC